MKTMIEYETIDALDFIIGGTVISEYGEYIAHEFVHPPSKGLYIFLIEEREKREVKHE